MTTDLWMLVAAVGLGWAQIMLPSTLMTLLQPRWAAGNRAGDVETPEFVRRLRRASENMKENLPLFASLVLIAHVSGEADATSALGSQIFVAGRALHAILYGVGIPILRTAAWGIGIVGMAMVAASLL